MTNKYLEKIAEGKKYKDPTSHAAGGALGSMALAQVGGFGMIAQEGIKGNFDSKAKYSKKELSSIRSYLRKNNLRNIKFEKTFTHAGPHFRLGENAPSIKQTASKLTRKSIKNFRRPIVNNPIRSFGVTMHELGHAKDYANKSPIRTRIQQGTQAATRVGGIPAGFALGYAASKNKKTEKYAPAIAALPSVPVIHSEISANINAFRHIKKTLGRKRALGYAASQVLPTLSYMGAYGAPAVATHFAQKAIKNNRKNND